ncbi:hypothetical protein G6F53_014044 [Rhizopus delemar]|nr:hypothetical protein G6F53_014044 [Rhizopus delemar]
MRTSDQALRSASLGRTGTEPPVAAGRRLRRVEADGGVRRARCRQPVAGAAARRIRHREDGTGRGPAQPRSAAAGAVRRGQLRPPTGSACGLVRARPWRQPVLPRGG